MLWPGPEHAPVSGVRSDVTIWLDGGGVGGEEFSFFFFFFFFFFLRTYVMSNATLCDMYIYMQMSLFCCILFFFCRVSVKLSSCLSVSLSPPRVAWW